MGGFSLLKNNSYVLIVLIGPGIGLKSINMDRGPGNAEMLQRYENGLTLGGKKKHVTPAQLSNFF